MHRADVVEDLPHLMETTRNWWTSKCQTLWELRLTLAPEDQDAFATSTGDLLEGCCWGHWHAMVFKKGVADQVSQSVGSRMAVFLEEDFSSEHTRIAHLHAETTATN